MNQGPSSDALKASDSNHSEKYQALGLNQDHTSPYYAPAAPVATSWTDYWSNSYPRENGVGSVSGYNHVQPAALTSQSSGDGLNVTPVASTSSSGSVHAPQDYSGYASYSSTDPYGNAGYAGYYNSYQQQTTQSYLPGPPPGPPPVGAYQNSGAPYQPISSFQNTGSYAATTNNSSTYYNHADYQNSGGYQSGAFSNHTNYWPEGQYASYTSHQYPNYPAEPTSVYSSTSSASTTSSQYTQQYKQWPDYYNQTQTEVTCAPGTENLSVPGASSQSYPHPASTTGYPTMYSQPENPTMYSQPSAAYTPSWRPESNSSELPSNQTGTVNAGVHDGYWNPGTSGFQNHNSSSVQPHVQAPLPINSTYDNFQNQQKPIDSQGYSVPYPSSAQVAQTYQPSVQAVPPVDSRRGSKLQIPTNPRIASNLGLGVPKTDKDISANNIASKPAYVSVSLPKPNDKVPSDEATADSILKPGMFPKSLCGYVERSLARCKDDVQMAAAQAVMKEIITKSTADGTLYTKDWDTEPLFSLPNADTVYKEGTQFSIPASSLQKTKRSPNRRGKSRWEPISEEKPEKPMVATPKTPKFGSWNKQFASFKSESKVNNSSDGKFSSTDEKPSIRSIGIPGKRQRLSNGPKGGDHGDKSSDSDKEQSLASYYPAAVALADSPEEKKRREHRSKRFDKGNGNRSENKHFKPKNFRVGNYHDRRASALVLSQNFEDSVSAAVEDIDWDALTVKGTCQDIEKRYLRLTSAPDPATVRPEEVLEKALLMVQKSERNYLYKCDQLKSIRQDLTVQRIRNELTVKVYETHARLAIEVGDLAEYNQCQSQLQTLYAEGIEGCHMEFAAYNLLCAILHSHNNRDLLSAMSRLSPKARKNDMVKHAFAVRGAVTSGNYVSFFRLYKAAPNLTSTYLMDLYVEKMRYKAVKCMSRSYRPTVPVLYISQVLGFSSFSGSIEPSNKKEIDGTEECIEWLKAHGACLMKDDTEELLFDTKISMSSLYMPEPEDAVAHGDASLAVDDFLTRTPGSVS